MYSKSISHHFARSVISTLLSPVQPLKALAPILVTLLGTVMLVSSVQFPKAFLLILFTPKRIVTFLSPLHP